MNIQSNEKLNQFLTSQPILGLVSMNKEGYPSIRNVHFIHDATSLYITSFEPADKIVEIKANPNIAFSVDKDENDFNGAPYNVRGFGQAFVINSDEEKVNILQKIAEKSPYIKDLNLASEKMLAFKIKLDTLLFQDFSKGFQDIEKLTFA